MKKLNELNFDWKLPVISDGEVTYNDVTKKFECNGVVVTSLQALSAYQSGSMILGNVELSNTVADNLDLLKFIILSRYNQVQNLIGKNELRKVQPELGSLSYYIEDLIGLDRNEFDDNKELLFEYIGKDNNIFKSTEMGYITSFSDFDIESLSETYFYQNDYIHYGSKSNFINDNNAMKLLIKFDEFDGNIRSFINNKVPSSGQSSSIAADIVSECRYIIYKMRNDGELAEDIVSDSNFCSLFNMSKVLEGDGKGTISNQESARLVKKAAEFMDLVHPNSGLQLEYVTDEISDSIKNYHNPSIWMVSDDIITYVALVMIAIQLICNDSPDNSEFSKLYEGDHSFLSQSPDYEFMRGKINY